MTMASSSVGTRSCTTSPVAALTIPDIGIAMLASASAYAGATASPIGSPLWNNTVPTTRAPKVAANETVNQNDFGIVDPTSDCSLRTCMSQSLDCQHQTQVAR